MIPHEIQDDGRVLARYARAVKGIDLATAPAVAVWLDQAFHMVALFLLALAVDA